MWGKVSWGVIHVPRSSHINFQANTVTTVDVITAFRVFCNVSLTCCEQKVYTVFGMLSCNNEAERFIVCKHHKNLLKTPASIRVITVRVLGVVREDEVHVLKGGVGRVR